MNHSKHPAAVLAILSALLAGVPCMAEENSSNQAAEIQLSDEKITVNGKELRMEACEDNDDTVVSENGVFLSNDIVYYEDRDTYDSGNVYGEGTEKDKHTEKEALAHTVINITEPGTYRISGQLSQGQIAVDLGSDAKTDPQAVVTLILDHADITCTVAPVLLVYNVYECDTAWTAYDDGKTKDYSASALQDTSRAGFHLILADDSINHLIGSYVARIYKDDKEQKKKHKYDGAVCSNMSLSIDGEEAGNGVLSIEGEKEGLESSLHLTINGGSIYVQSQDDGINSNEDGVSVTTVNGGFLHIAAGLGTEGDGIDSNGYLMINGGTIIASANPASDSGLDSDMGSYINGGYVVATGSTMDWAESDSDQVTMNLQFASLQNPDEAIIVTDSQENVLFAYDPDKDEAIGLKGRNYQGAVISCPDFSVGDTCYIYVGGDVTGEETNGLYDVSTVTGFEGAALQQFTGTDVGREGFGGPGMGKPERNGNGMDRPMDRIEMNNAGIDPARADLTETEQAETDLTETDLAETDLAETEAGINDTETESLSNIHIPEKPQEGNDSTPNGMMPPYNDSDTSGNVTPPDIDGSSSKGSIPPWKPEGTFQPDDKSFSSEAADHQSEPSCEFYIADKVNAFSGITDISSEAEI